VRAMVPFKDRLYLVVAGQAKQGMSIQSLQQLAYQLDIQDSIKWIPYYVPYEEVPNLFELSDWLALPYSKTFTSQSGVLNVAIAHRCPILATDIATVGQTIHELQIGFIVPPDCVEALISGIAQMLVRFREFASERFQAAATRLSWETNVELTVQVYQNMCR